VDAPLEDATAVRCFLPAASARSHEEPLFVDRNRGAPPVGLLVSLLFCPATTQLHVAPTGDEAEVSSYNCFAELPPCVAGTAPAVGLGFGKLSTRRQPAPPTAHALPPLLIDWLPDCYHRTIMVT